MKDRKLSISSNTALSLLMLVLVAVLLLSGVIAKETRHYLKNLDEVDTTEIPVVDK